MYLFMGRRGGKSDRGKCNRSRAKARAKNRRRVNRMHGRRLSARLSRRK
jgi:hypothetical protein